MKFTKIISNTVLFMLTFLFQYQWSVEGQNSMALDPDDIITSTKSHFSTLEVRSGALRPGRIYTFTLNASQPDRGHQGSASMTLLSGLPPHGGLCDLTPDSDIHLLETIVTYNCTGEKVMLSLFVKQIDISSKRLFNLDFLFRVEGGKIMRAQPLS